MQHKTSTNSILITSGLLLFVLFFVSSCATYHSQFGKEATSVGGLPTIDTTQIVHQLYFTASVASDTTTHFNQEFKKQLTNASKASSLVLLGNNLGTSNIFSSKNDSLRKNAEQHLKKQIALFSDFKGTTFFVPGKQEWEPEGQNSILKLTTFFESQAKNRMYLSPKKGCGLETVQLNEQVVLITLDSQWFLEDWNQYDNMNAGCQNQTRDMLLDELSFILSQNQNKTVVLAMQNPVFSNGISGGQTSFKDQLYVPQISFPLPIFGSIYHVLRKSAGWYPDDLQHTNYRNFAEKIKAEIKKYQNVLVISGNEKNLQYIFKDGIHQIISASGDAFSAVRAINPKDFSFGGKGYGVLNFYKSGAVKLTFKSVNNEKSIDLFTNFVLKGKPLQTTFETKKYASKVNFSIDADGTTERGSFYQFLWGKHHQKTYQTPFEISVTDLDNLHGGLKPIGLERYGTASYWVFEDKKGKNYWAIPLQKEVTDFLQTQIFQSQADKAQFQKKITEDFFEDYFTTTFPFAPFITASLEHEIGLKTSKPDLFYISNNKPIEISNSKMKSGHYFITEKPTTAHKEIFGLNEKDYIINTDDLLYALKTETQHRINKEAYIKTRLLDMLIGDWNRNPAFYRWVAQTKGNETVYEPIPFQRDQAFAKYDGFLLGSLKKLPSMGAMYSYNDQWANLYLFNEAGFVLDMALLSDTTPEDWARVAKKMQTELSFDKIQKAFETIPVELQNISLENGAYILKNRLHKLDKKAKNYGKLLSKRPMIVGTTKADKIKISVLEKGFVQITIFENADTKTPKFDRIFSKKTTKEIIIYGLEGDDYFEGLNTEKCPIKIRLIGGQGKDQYVGLFSKKIHLYDFESNALPPENPTTAKVTLANDYDTNIYQNQIIRKPKIDAAPLFGFNPDDGLRVGARLDLTTFAFGKKPFSQQHFFASHYYFATEGYDLQYGNIIKNAYKKWDFVLNTNVTSVNFAVNFFGFGNETDNFDQTLGFDYNRVKMRTISVQPGVKWSNETGNEFSVFTTYQAFEVEKTPDRFIENANETTIFELQSFVGWKTRYQFSNQNKPFDPSLGLRFFGQFSWQANTQNFGRQVPMLSTGLWTIYNLVPDGSLLLETTLEGKRILSNTFEFYQGATLGGDADLRGFRDQRFTGKYSFFQQSNVRASIGQIKNPFAPVYYGIQAGFDYGRIWMPNETSTQWHNSYGGGFWFKTAHLVMGNVAYFKSSDGGRLSFRMVYNF